MFTVFRRKPPQNVIKLLLNITAKKACHNSYCPGPIPSLVPIDVRCNLNTVRFKSKKSQKRPAREVSESETEEESTFDDQIVDKNTKMIQVNVKSLRVDGLLKSGLGISRNKIETLFYESKIRVNGQKLLKKSELANEGDEIDIVKGVSVTNPDFLTVARVEILGITEKGENVSVKIRRCKNLTIENYKESVDTG